MNPDIRNAPRARCGPASQVVLLVCDEPRRSAELLGSAQEVRSLSGEERVGRVIAVEAFIKGAGEAPDDFGQGALDLISAGQRSEVDAVRARAIALVEGQPQSR